ncbi:MAG: hypothetical protein ABI760_06740 [Ferruginibacter sp.]
MKTYFLIMLLIGQLAFTTKSFSQNIAINGTGVLPDESAMLDVSSTTKGFLTPRMTTAQQNAILLPTLGLLVFNTTDNVFKVNTSNNPAIPAWTPLLGSGGAVSSVNGLTAAVQTFATGNTGADFNISSTGFTHTLNMPDASVTTRGVVTTGLQTFSGAKTWNHTGTFLAGITAMGGTINLNTDATANGVNIGTSTNTGAVTIGGTGTQTISIGNGLAAKTVNIGSSATTSTTTILSGSGGIMINNANNQPTSIGTGTSTGAVTIGGTGIQSINLGTGATGIKTIGIGTGAAANIISIGSATGAASLSQRVGTGNFSLDGAGGSIYSIGASTTSGTITIGGTAQTGAITIGSSSGPQTLNLGTGGGVSTVIIGDNLNATSGTTLIGGSTTINGAFNYGRSINTDDSYVVTLNPAPTSYTTGMLIILDANSNNSGSCTLNVNNLGIRNILKGGSNPPKNAINANGICILIYDGTSFQLISQ